MNQLRIAWLSPYLPAPCNSGGRIRIAQLARSLAHHELSLFARLNRDDETPGEATREDLASFSHVHALPPDRVRLPALTPAIPRSFPRALWQQVEAEDAQRPFDAVILEHCYAMHWYRPLRRAAAILNEHNVESDYWLGEARTKSSPPLFVDYLRWRAFERRSWQRADAVTAVTVEDARNIEQVRGQCLVIGNGVALENFDFVRPAQRQGRGILFVGTMSYGPNVAAALELANEVLPLVRQRFPEARLTIAGRDPSKAVQALASEHVRVTGRVTSLRELFNQHAVYANPVSYGGGSSLKILEPLSAGLPLVAGEFAARGHGLLPDQHYLESQSAQDMARAIGRVLDAPGQHDDMAARARAFAERHSWKSLAAPFVELVERLAGRRAVT